MPGLLCPLLLTESFNFQPLFKTAVLYYGDQMKSCFIFGSMPIEEISVKPCYSDLIIAADAGLKNTERFNLKPDYIVGDFDSLEYIPDGSNVIKHPVKKDETDTILAVDVAFEKGYNNFIIYGCLGGRLDQTVASIQTASYITEKGGNAVFIDNETYLTVIKNNAIGFSKDNKGTVSVFSLSEKSYGVCENGLLYELKDAELTSNYPLGVSNEFIKKDAKISVNKGKICIIWNGKHGKWSVGGNYD